MKKIKKQGYYFSQGEVNPLYSSLSVPIQYSCKAVAPVSLTIVGSKNRFEYLDIAKLTAKLQTTADKIAQQFQQV